MAVTMDIATYPTETTGESGKVSRLRRRVLASLAAAGVATLEGFALSGEFYSPAAFDADADAEAGANAEASRLTRGPRRER